MKNEYYKYTWIHENGSGYVIAKELPLESEEHDTEAIREIYEEKYRCFDFVECIYGSKRHYGVSGKRCMLTDWDKKEHIPKNRIADEYFLGLI